MLTLPFLGGRVCFFRFFSWVFDNYVVINFGTTIQEDWSDLGVRFWPISSHFRSSVIFSIFQNHKNLQFFLQMELLQKIWAFLPKLYTVSKKYAKFSAKNLGICSKGFIAEKFWDFPPKDFLQYISWKKNLQIFSSKSFGKKPVPSFVLFYSFTITFGKKTTEIFVRDNSFCGWFLQLIFFVFIIISWWFLRLCSSYLQDGVNRYFSSYPKQIYMLYVSNTILFTFPFCFKIEKTYLFKIFSAKLI